MKTKSEQTSKQHHDHDIVYAGKTRKTIDVGQQAVVWVAGGAALGAFAGPEGAAVGALVGGIAALILRPKHS